jgi:hypothetical protein
MRKTAVAAAMFTLGTAGAARADNHFLLELEGGPTAPVGSEGTADDGYGGALTFGIGGRFRGSAPAFYVIGRAGWSDFGDVGPERTGAAHLEREQGEWAVGGRMYLPITERFRFMLQAAIGAISEQARISRAGHPTVQLDNDCYALFGDAGLQFRLTDHFSLGGNLGLAWQPGDGSPDLASLAAGIPDPDGEQGRLRFGLAATFHF